MLKCRIIKRTKKFNKEFEKLSQIQQTKSLIKIKDFETGKHDKQLKVNKLQGKYKDKWAFSIEYDLRVIYSIEGNEIKLYTLEHIGTHGKVYK